MELVLTEDLLLAVGRLPRPQREKVMEVIGQAEMDRCADDPLYWLDASRHVRTTKWPDGLPYVYTKDPHKIYTCELCKGEVVEDRRVGHLEVLHQYEHPGLHIVRDAFKLLPSVRPFTLMTYMPPIVDAWRTAQYFAIEKSRDMMATWLMVALYTWDAMFNSGRQHILQSEDAFKTLELVQRAKLIYDETPEFIRNSIGAASFSKGTTKAGELYFTKQKSEILGLPQGADQIRQWHPTGVLSDETAFQQEAGATFAAIKPAIMMGGRFTAISSANPSWFQLVCSDRTDD
jgi:hypothetical protein